MSNVSAYLRQPTKLQRATSDFQSRVPADQQSMVNDVLSAAPVSYRDGLMIQLAYRLCSGEPIDLTKRPDGARGVAGKLGRFLAGQHIQAVADAYQNIAKNSADLARGNVPSFDDFLR
jgi:hypothetical protein